MIVDAARYGDPQFDVSAAGGSGAAFLYRMFPNVAGELLGYITRFLPGPTAGDAGNNRWRARPWEAEVATSKLTEPVDKAAAQNNELGGNVPGAVGGIR